MGQFQFMCKVVTYTQTKPLIWKPNVLKPIVASKTHKSQWKPHIRLTTYQQINIMEKSK